MVVGSGPAGLVCAYFLAKHGYRPLLLERGTMVSDRIRDVKRFDAGGDFHPESNYLFGEGGAGTFSDGKLTCRGTGPDVARVLELFAECKGQQAGRPSILYYHRPHLGSNRLPAVVKAHPPADRGVRRRGAVPDAGWKTCTLGAGGVSARGHVERARSPPGWWCWPRDTAPGTRSRCW